MALIDETPPASESNVTTKPGASTAPKPATARCRLIHTCAQHPFAGQAHQPGCTSLCGMVSQTGAGGGPNQRGPDSCVVCNAMFDALYRSGR